MRFVFTVSFSNVRFVFMFMFEPSVLLVRSVNPLELLKNLQSLRIVTGQVLVQGSSDRNLTDLRFLRSIEIIHGTSSSSSSSSCLL